MEILLSRLDIIIIGLLLWFIIRGITIYCSAGEIVKINKKKELRIFLNAMYFTGLVAFVFFPLNIVIGRAVQVKPPKIYMGVVSGISILFRGNAMSFIVHTIGNLILLTPLAFILLLYKEEKYKNLIKIVIVSLAATCSIEFLQLVESYAIPLVARYVELGDIILNTISGVIGYYLFYSSIGQKVKEKLI